MKIRTHVCLARLATLLGLLTLNLQLTAAPLGTAFTYQGKLTQGGTDYTGNAEFQPTLWDTAGGGSQVGTNSPATLIVGVTNGLFLLPLDFGTVAFNAGQERWLQLEVRTNLEPFTTLSPRQRITPAPQALYALEASAATTAASAATVAAGGVANASLQANAVTSDKIADGTILEADLSPALAGKTFWRLGGNAGTLPGTDFLGTTDNQALEFKVNGQRALRLEPGDESPGLIAGHLGNTVTPGINGATIGGGGNLIEPNLVMGRFGTVSGGVGNVISTNAGDTTIGGGWLNVIAPLSGYATIGGGSHNTAGAVSATVAGGYANAALAQDSAVGGGYSNTAASASSVVAGGFRNHVESGYAGGVITGGTGNQVAAYNSSVVGGYENSISNLLDGFIGGGLQNRLSANHTVIGGGHHNTNESPTATIGGGSFNLVAPGYTGSFIGGGYGNQVAAHNSSVVGGYENSISNLVDGFIGGGLQNRLEADRTVIGGGLYNTNAGPGATIGGGNHNLVGTNANDALIGGGLYNRVEGWRSAIAGGEGNTIQTDSAYASIGAGQLNSIGTNSAWGTIAGGSNNTLTDNATFATIPGGLNNLATNFAFAAGRRAKAQHEGAFVWADSQDSDFSSSAANQFLIRASGNVGLGTNNPQTALHVAGAITADAFLGSGAGLTSLSGGALAPGSVGNAALAANAVTGNKIANGTIQPADLDVDVFASTFWKTDGNAGTNPDKQFLGTTDKQPLELRVNGLRALRFEDNGDGSDAGTIPDGAPNVIGGSPWNFVPAGVVGVTIGGGGATNFDGVAYTNSVGGDYGTVGGGYGNQVDAGAHFSIIAGGGANYIGTNSTSSVIGGGSDNNIGASSSGATIAGGYLNDVATNADYSAIGGGYDNNIAADSSSATIAGGYFNDIGTNADYSAIGGGYDNNIAGNATYATIPGGSLNAATNYAFAAGRRAKANHQGAFVWGDSYNGDIASTNANSVTMRASGGYRLFSNSGATVGAYLAAGSGSWTSMSDCNIKEAFQAVNPQDVLEKVATLPLSTWKYKSQDPSVRHLGPMAQDFKAAFALGESDTGISSVDADGVALAAIQGLNRKLEQKNAALEQQVADLKALVKTLVEKVNGESAGFPTDSGRTEVGGPQSQPALNRMGALP